ARPLRPPAPRPPAPAPPRRQRPRLLAGGRNDPTPPPGALTNARRDPRVPRPRSAAGRVCRPDQMLTETGRPRRPCVRTGASPRDRGHGRGVVFFGRDVEEPLRPDARRSSRASGAPSKPNGSTPAPRHVIVLPSGS